MVKCIASAALVTSFVTVFADWEQVSLGDKSDFDIKCIYQAKCLVKPGPGPLISTKFFNVSHNKIGYLPDSSGKLMNASIMANNKTIFTFKTEENYFIKNWTVVELKKKCLITTLKTHNEQKNGIIKIVPKVPDKSSLDNFYTGAYFFIE